MKRTLDFIVLERLLTNNKSLWSFFLLSISMFDLSKEHDHNCQHSFVTRVKNISSFLELNLLSVLAYNKINVDYNHTSNCIRD